MTNLYVLSKLLNGIWYLLNVWPICGCVGDFYSFQTLQNMKGSFSTLIMMIVLPGCADAELEDGGAAPAGRGQEGVRPRLRGPGGELQLYCTVLYCTAQCTILYCTAGGRLAGDRAAATQHRHH